MPETAEATEVLENQENQPEVEETGTVQEMSELIERATQLGIELGADVPEVTHG
mgnify:CR=1 FL=1